MAPSRLPKSPAFWKVAKLEKVLMKLPSSNVTLSTRTLKDLGIERAPQLDIDNPDAADPHPVYFKPLAENPSLRKVVLGHEDEVRCWSHCRHERSHGDRLSCALHAIYWLEDHRVGAVEIANLYPADELQWIRGSYGPNRKFCSYSASTEYLKKHGERPGGFQPEWFSPQAFVVDDNTARHATCYVADNTSHRNKPDEPLRSEIATAVSFIRRQMQGYNDVNSTIPVLIYSVYHNETARITQMCWTGEHNPITFRQSRLLNIASDSIDSPDILLLLRWMACIPLRKPSVSRRPTAPGAQAAAPLLKPGPALPTGARGHSTAASPPPHAGRPHANANPSRPATPEQRQLGPGPTYRYTGSGGSPSHGSSPLRQASTPGRPTTGSSLPVTSTATPPHRQPDAGTYPATAPATNTANTGGTPPRQNTTSSSSTPLRNGPPPGGSLPQAPHRTTNLPTRSAAVGGPQGQQAERYGYGSHR